MEGIRDLAKAFYARADGSEKQLVKDYFKKLDLNSDGKISLSEFKRNVEPELSFDYIFNQLDINGDGTLDFEDVLLLMYLIYHMWATKCDGCRLLLGSYFSCTLCLGEYPNTHDLCCSCYAGGQFEHKHSKKYFLNHRRLLRKVLAERKEGKLEHAEIERELNSAKIKLEEHQLKHDKIERDLYSAQLKQEEHLIKHEEVERELHSAQVEKEELWLKHEVVEMKLHSAQVEKEKCWIKQQELEGELHSAQVEKEEHRLKHEEVEKELQPARLQLVDHQVTITALKTEVETLRSAAKVNNEVKYGDWLKKIIISGFIGLIFQFFIMKMIPFIWSFTILTIMLGIKMINKIVSKSAERLDTEDIYLHLHIFCSCVSGEIDEVVQGM